jgi:hypothetical protein
VRAHDLLAFARDLQDDSRPDEESVMRRDDRRGGVVRLIVEAHLRARISGPPVSGREAFGILPGRGAAIGFASLRFRFREQSRFVEGSERGRKAGSSRERARPLLHVEPNVHGGVVGAGLDGRRDLRIEVALLAQDTPDLGLVPRLEIALPWIARPEADGVEDAA